MTCKEARRIHVGILSFHAQMNHVPLNRMFEYRWQVMFADDLFDLPANKGFCRSLHLNSYLVPFAKAIHGSFDESFTILVYCLQAEVLPFIGATVFYGFMPRRKYYGKFRVFHADTREPSGFFKF